MSTIATDQSLTWAGFNAAVDANLSTDKNRLTEGEEKDNWIKSAVKELQEFIPSMKLGHQSIYLPSDLAPHGDASRGVLPPGKVTSVHIVKVTKNLDGTTDEEERHPLSRIDWKDRNRMIHAQLDVTGGTGFICRDPESYTFYVYPRIAENMMVDFWWNGLKDDFSHADSVPFTRFQAECVAYFVRREMRRDMEEEIGLFNSFNKSYVDRRLSIYREYMDAL